MGETFSAILSRFGWRHVALFYHNYAVSSGRGHSLCHFSLGTVYTALNQTPVFRSFDETHDDYDFHGALKSLSSKARSELFHTFSCTSIHTNPNTQFTQYKQLFVKIGSHQNCFVKKAVKIIGMAYVNKLFAFKPVHNFTCISHDRHTESSAYDVT